MSELREKNLLESNFENQVAFVEVNKEHPLFPQVEVLFNQIIAPLYGDQTNALKKIGEAKDRKCQLLMENGEIRGVLVYKSEPNNEFAQMGGCKLLKLKHFLLLILKTIEVVALVLNCLLKL